LVTPEFTQVNPICSGGSLNELPTTSSNGITGSWSPALDNTATREYTFIPNPDQCATTTSLTITVIPNVTPEFSNVGSFCAGQEIANLPTTSLNGITGVWVPEINNQQTTTYTFTPDSGQCATSFQLTIEIQNDFSVPQFELPTQLCLGGSIAFFPSISQNGISGVWTPALNLEQTTLYTFTPNAGQCAEIVTHLLTITEPVTTSFEFTSHVEVCLGANFELPFVSSEGIPGTWNPSFVNTTVGGSYTFTPEANQCALPFTLFVNIEPKLELTAIQGCFDDRYRLVGSITSGTAFSVGWWDQSGNQLSNSLEYFPSAPGLYTFIAISSLGCEDFITVEVNSTFCDIPKGISPNGDGLNDFWDLSNLPVLKAQIFNRYGMEVFSKANYRNEWNGRDKKGNELPTATYYYVVTFENGTHKTGWVYLQRE
jgi:gliding motility-associated-like protein